MLLRPQSSKLCQSCQRDISNLLRHGFTDARSTRHVTGPWKYSELQPARRLCQRLSGVRALHSTRAIRNASADPQSQTLHHHELPPERDTIEVALTAEGSAKSENTSGDHNERLEYPKVDSITCARDNGHSVEAVVREARQVHGEYLPSGTLTSEEYVSYLRLYGQPVEPLDELEEDQEEIEEHLTAHDTTPQLFRDSADGSLEPVNLHDDPQLGQDAAVEVDEDADTESSETSESQSLQARAKKIAEELEGQVYQDEQGNVVEDDDVAQTRRLHPLTIEARFSTSSTTIFLPEATLTGPTQRILRDYSNKHISEAALRAFGGPGLPSGLATPAARRQDMQVPIGLNASQHGMSEMEANAFISVLWPGIYASIQSVLVEVRRRQGSDWLRKLMSKAGGPRILDVGAGGAAILAWRDIIKAEWQAAYPNEPIDDAPFGKATVLTGAESLRHRSAQLLENTTFIPRLPDYVHVRDSPTLDDDSPLPQRKQFDVIIAPHSLWHIKEDYLRKQHVQNLWSLLSSEGGVLVLLEKGVPRGFEVVAGAREMILERFIASPGSETFEEQVQTPGDERFVNKSPGMIIAPCTNHNTCPMYATSGVSHGRKDLCVFEQRYIRPQYLQRILEAKHRNHEDLAFSYLAVQKGIDQRQTAGLVQGPRATESAFKGYESSSSVNTLSLPRIIYPPIKRRGHVIIDVCTPEGKSERWTVPKSFSKQAHHDARKSSWGDLWALGAKTRIPRKVRLGKQKLKTKEQRLQADAEELAARKEDDRLEEGLSGESIDDELFAGMDEDETEIAAEIENPENDLEDPEDDAALEAWQQEYTKDRRDAAQARLSSSPSTRTSPLKSQNKGVQAGRSAKSRDRAGASKFAAGGIRVRQPTKKRNAER